MMALDELKGLIDELEGLRDTRILTGSERKRLSRYKRSRQDLHDTGSQPTDTPLDIPVALPRQTHHYHETEREYQRGFVVWLACNGYHNIEQYVQCGSAGELDVMAIDGAGVIHVFELKRDKGCDGALGQVLRYTGQWCTHMGHTTNFMMHVVAPKIDRKLLHATSVISIPIEFWEWDGLCADIHIMNVKE